MEARPTGSGGPTSGAVKLKGNVGKAIGRLNQDTKQPVPPIPPKPVTRIDPDGNRGAIERREFPKLVSHPLRQPITTLTHSNDHPLKVASDNEQPSHSSKNGLPEKRDHDSKPLGSSPQQDSVAPKRFRNTVSFIKDVLMSDKSRYRKTKASLGLLFGVIFGVFMYWALYVALENNWRRALIISATTTFFVMLGLGFSVRIRCVATLMMPTVCTSEGRGAIYAVIIGLLLSGPMQNIYLNAEETANAMSCSFEMAVNLSMELQDATQRVINNYVDVIAKGTDGLQESSQTLYNVFNSVERQLDGLERSFGELHQTISNVADECEATIGSARTDCNNDINGAYRDCKSGLPGFTDARRSRRQAFNRPGLPDLPDLPDPSSGFRDVPIQDDACSVLDVDDVCDVLDVGNVCRPIPVTNVVNLLLAELLEFREALRVDVQVSSEWENRQVSNGSLMAIRDAVQEDLQGTHDVIKKIFEISDKILAFSLLWLAIRSYSYYWKFCTKDEFDNLYITDAFVKMDKRRKTEGERHLLPLKKSERRQYVELTSFKLSKPERGLFKVGLVMVFMHATISLLVIVADYGLYWLLMLLQEHGEFRYTLESTGQIDVTVGGTGLLSDIVRWMFLDGISSASSYNATIDTSICLPQPSAPRINTSAIIGLLYAFTLLTVLCQAYMLRLRRFIASYYYPEREIERTEYLYNKALNRRDNLVRLLKSGMEQRLREMRRIKSMGLLDYLKKKCPCLVKVLGALGSYNKYCQGCRDKDKDGDFQHCSDETCDCIYCEECAQEAGGTCACNEAIEDRINCKAESKC